MVSRGVTAGALVSRAAVPLPDMSLLDTLLEAARFIELQEERRLQAGKSRIMSVYLPVSRGAIPERVFTRYRRPTSRVKPVPGRAPIRERPVAGAPVQRADARRS